MNSENSDTPSNPERVATGDRRDEVWMEPDKDQLVRMRATFKPDHLPPEMSPDEPGDLPPEQGPPVQDVAVPHAPESVWDARPPEDREGS
jgi:hypothetical protein